MGPLLIQCTLSWNFHIPSASSSFLILYQPMMANATISFRKEICGECNTRCYTITQGFACLSCFLWLVKSEPYPFMGGGYIAVI